MKRYIYSAICPYCGHENRVRSLNEAEWIPTKITTCLHYWQHQPQRGTGGCFWFRIAEYVDGKLTVIDEEVLHA
jgi:hypothetical protein